MCHVLVYKGVMWRQPKFGLKKCRFSNKATDLFKRKYFVLLINYENSFLYNTNIFLIRLTFYLTNLINKKKII